MTEPGNTDEAARREQDRLNEQERREAYARVKVRYEKVREMLNY